MSDGIVARVVNTALIVIVAFVGTHAVFILFEANRRNGIVKAVSVVAEFFMAPFTGIFRRQSDLTTSLIAVLAYALLAGLTLAINQRVRARRS